MPIQKFTARLSEAQMIAEKFWFGKLELIEPNRLDFVAGQYLLLDVPGSPQKKSYSIASDPSMSYAVELLVDVSPHGAGTTYLGGLKPGDAVSFYAPAGEFVLPEKGSTAFTEEKELEFVATGTGIAPLRSMYRDLLQNQKDSRRMKLYWGLRSEADICWLEELQELANAFPNFSFDIILSKPSEGWTLHSGHVTEYVLTNARPGIGYYLCGNPRMVAEVSEGLQNKTIDPSHIHSEKFYAEVKSEAKKEQ